MRWLWLVSVLALLGACSTDGPTRPNTTASGLSFRDLRRGRGTPAGTGDYVTIHYTLWLENGTKVDSSRDRQEPFEFTLGRGIVIAGFDEGITGMRVTGIRKLW